MKYEGLSKSFLGIMIQLLKVRQGRAETGELMKSVMDLESKVGDKQLAQFLGERVIPKFAETEASVRGRGGGN